MQEYIWAFKMLFTLTSFIELQWMVIPNVKC